MKALSLLFFLGCTSVAMGQRFYPTGVQSRETISVYGGFTGFFGDLEGSNSYIDTNPHLGLSYEYLVLPRVGLRAYGLWYKIEADDAKAQEQSLQNRNLSFHSSNLEAGLQAVVYAGGTSFTNYADRNRFNLYGILGIGFTHYNPKTYYSGPENGNRKVEYELREIRTENVEYGNWAVVIPFGGGLMLKLSDQWDLAGEIKYHYTFTDYLDDCSRRYPTTYRNDLHRALADRRPEGVNTGGQRGNPTITDGYATYSLRLGYRLVRYSFKGKEVQKRLRRGL